MNVPAPFDQRTRSAFTSSIRFATLALGSSSALTGPQAHEQQHREHPFADFKAEALARLFEEPRRRVVARLPVDGLNHWLPLGAHPLATIVEELLDQSFDQVTLGGRLLAPEHTGVGVAVLRGEDRQDV